MSSEERVAIALERIADALEKQNAGNDEEFKLRVFAAISQGIPATIMSPVGAISGGYINCDEKVVCVAPRGRSIKKVIEIADGVLVGVLE